ncbi:Protein of unknown function DUF361 [Methanocaldococcus infernus ME]|uniref:Class III signal peptide-containing protein n=1 Tax=Methanocaldococcus infernus (strain DSM 11812 / JCM 15783 / ME) TaxID=573063 RepID=D5VR18_METIM|nr:class III signal peptide-containing protein [Methanocaldococcus infernus]ADG13021.1 Protein of unknown function DUF361 [Methanocaldococcus infernus ME]
MKILEKLLSKRGQISMEIGILVAAAVAVAALAAYFYVTNIKSASTKAGQHANTTVETLGGAAEQAAEKIQNIT